MKRLVDLLWLLKKVKYAKEVQPLKVQKNHWIGSSSLNGQLRWNNLSGKKHNQCLSANNTKTSWIGFGKLTARISRDSPTRQYVQIANLI